MKKILIFILTAIALSTPALADTWVNGYVRSDGTHVKSHYRSSPKRITPYKRPSPSKLRKIPSYKNKNIRIDGYFRSNGIYVKPHYRSR